MKKVKLTVNATHAILPIRGRMIRCPFDMTISTDSELNQIKALLRSYAITDYSIDSVNRVKKKVKTEHVKNTKPKITKKAPSSTLEKLLE